MRIKIKNILYLLDCVFFLISLLMMVYAPLQYDEDIKKIIGVAIVGISIRLFFRNKQNKIFFIVFGIILYINASLVASDCFFDGELALPESTISWQIYRGSEYEIIFLIGLNLFLNFLNIILCKPRYFVDKLRKKDNSLVFFCSYFFLIYILFSGYSGKLGHSYISETSTLYEYGLAFFILTWFYAGNSKNKSIALIIYGVLYILQALVYGDRSSAFPMVLLLYTLYAKRVSLKNVLVLSLIGIFSANIIAVYRESYSMFAFYDSYLSRYGLTSIVSDTVSQSYYTGISLMAVRDMLNDTSTMVVAFLLGMFYGGDYADANVTEVGKLFATNKGGGFIIADFVFWFGYPGAMIIGIIIGVFMLFVSRNRFDIELPWKLYFSVTVFRWYLYTAFDLFRGVFFVFPVLYLTYFVCDKTTRYLISKF